MLDQTFLFYQAVERLALQGLNLVTVLDLADLPQPILDTIRTNPISLEHYSRLVLVGNGGKRFWESLAQFGLTEPDPIDFYSQRLTQTLIDEISTPADTNLILYPQTSFMIPLQQLGELAGWGKPSPIGNSISSEFGLWFAFRASFLSSIPLPVSEINQQPSPCLTCIDKPCQTACPAEAVLETSADFRLKGCISHRLQENSVCAFRCLARQACPIGIENRYPDWAINRLYSASITSIRDWQSNQRK